MTRGTIILIENEKEKTQVHYSCEFNGDMFISNYGKEVIYTLEKITKVSQFEKYIFYFNDHHYGYPDNYANITLKELKENIFNIKDFLCDYLYIKNISNKEIEIKNENITEKIIKPNEIVVLHYKKYIDYKDKFKEYNSIFESE